MTLQLWLAAELRAAGLNVLEVAGWQSRQTRTGFTPLGVVCHDTVTPPGMSRAAEQAILVNGRPDLAGPLAQLGVHRDGVVSVIAAGRCNHNGFGSWGNDAYGIEVFCYGGQPGHEEPYNEAQRDTVARIGAVICKHHGWDASHVKGHKETDPSRKIDPWGTDMAVMRLSVAWFLNPKPKPPDPEPEPQPEDDMDYPSAIRTLYQVHLGREPDRPGFHSWCQDYASKVAAGGNPVAVMAGIEGFFSGVTV